MIITIQLDGPPRGKGAGRAVNTAEGPRIFTDERTRKYEAQLRFAAQQVMDGRLPLIGPLQVEIEVRFLIPTSFTKRKRAQIAAGLLFPAIRPDVENFCKAMDGLNGVVWRDDKQIVIETIRKVYSERPGITITVYTLVLPETREYRDQASSEAGPLFA